VSMAGLSILNCPDELQDPKTESSAAGSMRWLAACELLLVPSIAFYINLNPSRNGVMKALNLSIPASSHNITGGLALSSCRTNIRTGTLLSRH
jgi:hypothetical protein